MVLDHRAVQPQVVSTCAALLSWPFITALATIFLKHLIPDDLSIKIGGHAGGHHIFLNVMAVHH